MAKTTTLSGAAFQKEVFWVEPVNKKEFYIVECENTYLFADYPDIKPTPMSEEQVCKIEFLYDNTRITITTIRHPRGKYNKYFSIIISEIIDFLNVTRLK